MIRKIGMAALTAALGASSLADQYWISWDGTDWPENQGWTRIWGNWDGLYQGEGAHRTLEDGVLTYDSLFDDGVYDFSRVYRPGQMDPAPGELFVMEWRLKVLQVDGYADPDVGVSSNDAWRLGLEFGYDRIYSIFEGYLEIPFAAGAWHSYAVVSSDMRTYDLYIDGELAREGNFVHLVSPGRIGWGDAIQGAASLHSWDYFRFGVVPEPVPLVMVLVVGASVVRGRRQ